MQLNHHITPFGIELEETEYTPGSLICAVNEKLTAAAPVLCLTGIVVRCSEQPYYGYYFAQLLEPENTDYAIKLKIPQALLSDISSGQLCTLQGYLEKQISTRKDSSLGLVFRVAKVLSTKKHNLFEQAATKRAAIIATKQPVDREKVKHSLLRSLKKRGHISLLLITGENAVTAMDVMKSLSTDKSYYRIDIQRVNFAQAEPVCTALRQGEKSRRYEVIALVRGGGEGLSLFSHPGVLQAAASIKQAYLVTALGHFADCPPVESVADYVCGTPTDFGYFLSGLVHDMRRERYHKKMISSKRKAWLIASLSLIGLLWLLAHYFTVS